MSGETSVQSSDTIIDSRDEWLAEYRRDQEQNLQAIMFISDHPEVLDTIPEHVSQEPLECDDLLPWTQENNIQFTEYGWLSSSLEMKDVKKFFRKRPRVLELLAQRDVNNPEYTAEDLNEYSSIDVAHILNALRRERQENLLYEALKPLKNEAEELLQRHFPQVGKPKQPNVVALSQEVSISERDIRSMQYLGKFADRHFLGVFIPTDMTPEQLRQEILTDANSRTWYRLAFAHEMIHQRHAELIGQEAFHGDGMLLDNLATFEEFKHSSLAHTYQELSKRRYDLFTDAQYFFNMHLLSESFREGATVCLTLMLAWKEAMVTTNDEDRACYYKFIQKELEGKTWEENYQRVSAEPSLMYVDERYINGPHIVEKLLEHLPTIEQLIDFFTKIDIRKLYGIVKGSPEWNAIMEDPWEELPKIAARD